MKTDLSYNNLNYGELYEEYKNIMNESLNI